MRALDATMGVPTVPTLCGATSVTWVSPTSMAPVNILHNAPQLSTSTATQITANGASRVVPTVATPLHAIGVRRGMRRLGTSVRTRVLNVEVGCTTIPPTIDA
jgi:hypothetical protein